VPTELIGACSWRGGARSTIPATIAAARSRESQARTARIAGAKTAAAGPPLRGRVLAAVPQHPAAGDQRTQVSRQPGSAQCTSMWPWPGNVTGAAAAPARGPAVTGAAPRVLSSEPALGMPDLTPLTPLTPRGGVPDEAAIAGLFTSHGTKVLGPSCPDPRLARSQRRRTGMRGTSAARSIRCSFAVVSSDGSSSRTSGGAGPLAAAPASAGYCGAARGDSRARVCAGAR
jgi:hypothetical protein